MTEHHRTERVSCLYTMRKKYDLEGNQLDNTAILDMYAVDKESHEVYPSGRQAWADAGNAAYREATGE